MRTLWPLATLILLALGAVALWRDPLRQCDVVEAGGALHLTRLGVETMRAHFCYAADCRLIAAQMNKVERATWTCG